MPGHKRNLDFLPPNLGLLDYTEIPGLDVLSAPTGILADLQQRIANVYESKNSYLLVNGSSTGIVAAICATCSINTPFVAPRNAHISMYSGLTLSGACPMYILPEITSDGLAGGIAPSAFDNMPKGAVAFVVSPTYEGFVSDISAIAKKVHERGGILIVDEAHGAHFAFDKKNFPATAIHQGADIVVNSLHKTLPALSQTAVLHVNSHRIDMSRLQFYINAIQTSSPSYMLMAVCDFMLHKLCNTPEIFTTYIEKLESIRDLLPSKNAPLCLSGRESVGEHAIYDIDLGKLLFTTYAHQDANTIAETMRSKFKIQMEMARGKHFLAMTSVADTNDGFERLKLAVTRLNADIPYVYSMYNVPSLTVPKVVLTPSEAIRHDTELMPWDEAIGRISGEIITEYPPGIVLIAPGERISAEMPIKKSSVRVLKG
ncbi:MAG: aminotransferase class I/II-fold pyridoxal phosphate-dependent enzyme [Defluviitaleaceae bacterium]|nr:aminotransferase class I/II-fold pyridoxal phosphate-dependent enzyme [Defluviitaleaceae bacterium]